MKTFLLCLLSGEGQGERERERKGEGGSRQQVDNQRNSRRRRVTGTLSAREINEPFLQLGLSLYFLEAAMITTLESCTASAIASSGGPTVRGKTM